jgi:hypothetical protein
MKKVSLSIMLLAMIISSAFAGDKEEKLTLKEKIENSKEVKLFFNVRTDIIDEADENKLKLTNPDAKTKIRTPLPVSFYSEEIKNEVIKILNTGLGVGNAFVEADASSLNATLERNHCYKDMSGLPDGFYAMVYITGTYTRFEDQTAKEVDGKMVHESSNRMEIDSRLFFYEVEAGKVKKYGDVLMKSGILLGHASAQMIKTYKVEDLEFMETNFPAEPLLDGYKRTMYQFTKDFTERTMKKHEKALAKRK